MIKGCNKRVIVMKETGNAMIEEAFFILRPGVEKNAITQDDIIKHANSILEKSTYNNRFSSVSISTSKEHRKKIPLPFLFGMMLGILVSSAVFYII